MEVGEDERRHLLAGDALLVRLGERPLDQRLDVVEAVRRRAGRAGSRRGGRAASAPARSRAASAADSTRAETGGPPCAA